MTNVKIAYICSTAFNLDLCEDNGGPIRIYEIEVKVIRKLENGE